MSTGPARRFGVPVPRLGLLSAWSVVVLGLLYAAVLAAGLLSLESPEQPIQDPAFTVMESLILLMAPAMVGLMAAVHSWSPAKAKATTLVALLFMSSAASLTAIVHFAILTLSRQPEFTALPAWPLIFSFTWPSVAYALDILAWDLFFAFSMLFAAPAFSGTTLASTIRATMIASGLLALAGLAGVVTGNMQMRNIGIVGYLGFFVIAAFLLALLFQREDPKVEDER